MIPYAFEKKTEYLDILFELFIEVYNQFEEENEPEYEHVRQRFIGMPAIIVTYFWQTASKNRLTRKIILLRI